MSEQPRRRRRQQVVVEELRNPSVIETKKDNEHVLTRGKETEKGNYNPKKKKQTCKKQDKKRILLFILVVLVILIAVLSAVFITISRSPQKYDSMQTQVEDGHKSSSVPLATTEPEIKLAGVSRIDDTFSIRNGISFRMKKESILQAEAEYGSDLANSRGELSRFKLDGNSSKGYSSIAAYEINDIPFFRSGDERPTSRILYYFNDNDELIEMCYWEKGDNQLYSSKDAHADYNRMLDNLINKYGTPIGKLVNGEGNLFDGHSISYNSSYTALSLEKLNAEVESVKECAQWIIKYDDCYCLIELFLRKGYGYSADLGWWGPMMLSYRLFEFDEIQAFIEMAETEARRKTQDF